MNKMLTDFSPDALVRANRANLYELFRYFEHSPKMYGVSSALGIPAKKVDFREPLVA